MFHSRLSQLKLLEITTLHPSQESTVYLGKKKKKKKSPLTLYQVSFMHNLFSRNQTNSIQREVREESPVWKAKYKRLFYVI